jgi:hypothetical protein
MKRIVISKNTATAAACAKCTAWSNSPTSRDIIKPFAANATR